MQEMELLVQLVWISSMLSLWQMDPLLHGQYMLKLCCLYEARAEPHDYSTSANPDSRFLLYNRTLLLKCRDECEKALEYVRKSRQGHSFMGDYRCSSPRLWAGVGGPGGSGGEKLYAGQLEEMHAELECMRVRVLVKLATTIPPSWGRLRLTGNVALTTPANSYFNPHTTHNCMPKLYIFFLPQYPE